MAKRGRKPKENKDYFSQVEEQAVSDYIALSKVSSGLSFQMELMLSGKTEEEKQDIKKTEEYQKLKIEQYKTDSEKNKLYNSTLHAPFVKMVESIIRRYKKYVPDEQFQTTLDDTLGYLSTKIVNYNPDKGTKAYSYCGTVCKNRLTYKNIKFTKEQMRSTSYDEHIDELKDRGQCEMVEDDFSTLAQKLVSRSVSEIQKMVDSPAEYSLNENETRVGYAMIDVLSNWKTILIDDVDDLTNEHGRSSNKLQKSNILYYLREETRMSTKEVRDNMKKFKCMYWAMKQDELENS